MPSAYRVGLARTDITPPVGIKLAGFAARTDPSTGVYHPLRATAVAIDDGETPVLLVTAELLGFYDRTERVRAAIAERTGLAPEAMILAGSHTHCGPAIREMDVARHGELDHDYIDALVDGVAAIAEQAWGERAPARLRFGTGTAGFAVSRRQPDGQGGVAWKPAPGQPHDHEVPVLTIEDPDSGELRGVVMGYTCHPTGGNGLEIGGDYVAFAFDRIEERHPDAVVSFVQGCCGDQKPFKLNPQTGSFGVLDVDELRAYGFDLGDAVNAVIATGMLAEVSGPIRREQRVIAVETVPLDEELLRASLDDGPPFVRDWARRLLDRVEAGEAIEREIPFELQTVAFGDDLLWVTMAAEMTVEHGLRLKAELRGRFRDVWPMAYTNEMVGYIPVRRQIPEGGYEVWSAQQYWSRTGPYVDETEDRIHETVRAMVDG